MHAILDKLKQTKNIEQEFEKAITCFDGRTQAITFINPFSYLIVRNEHEVIEGMDAMYTDAISSAKIFSTLLDTKLPRISFDLGSFAKHFLTVCNEKAIPIYFIGAKPEEIEKAMSQFKSRYPDLNIVGYRDGYFNNDEQVAQDIVATGAEFVVCGLGTPKQDQFALRLKEVGKGQIKQIYTCGGFIHQSSEKVQYYPDFINKYNLRWLYRMFDSSYVFKRLVKDYPLFSLVVLKDRYFTKGPN